MAFLFHASGISQLQAGSAKLWDFLEQIRKGTGGQGGLKVPLKLFWTAKTRFSLKFAFCVFSFKTVSVETHGLADHWSATFY